MGMTVNFGLAILAFTVLIRLLTFPVMNKAFSSMSQMKKLAPELNKIRERYGDDREKLQKEIMELYQKEKVNPMSGCLLLLVQIPIFFALYKCIYITVDMRHAPFWGWVNDLSAPDPTTITNLFGLAPWEPLSFIQYGAWPLIYAVVSFAQQWLNPSSGDPAKDIPRYGMPLIFSYIFAKLPAGLVIYFAWSAGLSAVQQYFIHRKMGVDPIHGGEESEKPKKTDKKVEHGSNNDAPPSGPANSN
jgi:YidC/Oxa1 family membrane protein insertase